MIVLIENITGDIEPDGLREPEFVQARELLQNRVGRGISRGPGPGRPGRRGSLQGRNNLRPFRR